MTRFTRKFLTKLRYPKLLLLGISIFAGYLIYTDQNNFHFHRLIGNYEFFAAFIAGIFFAHGFTMGPAIAILLLLAPQLPLLETGLYASAGALIGNFVIFKTLRISYDEEISDLSQHSFFQKLTKFLDRITPLFVRRYILPAFAGMLSATPLPDEFTAALVHASRDMSFSVFTFVAFFFNIFGIFILLAIGKIIA
jgi:hypothetical protein